MDRAIIEQEAMRLSDIERALLADRLLQSITRLPSDVRTARIEEADERMAALSRGEVSLVDGPTAMDKLRSMFAR